MSSIGCRKKTSKAWKYFEIVDHRKAAARCKICSTVHTYRTSVSNLTSHIKRVHSDALRDDIYQVSDTEANVDVEFKNDSDSECEKHPQTNRSASWKYFTIKDSDLKLATCNICGAVCSYRSSLTNLMKHVRQKHPRVVERTNRSASSNRARRVSVATSASDVEGSGVDDEYLVAKNLEEFITRKDETESMCLLCEEKFPDSDLSKLTEHMLNDHNISKARIVEGNIQFQQEVSKRHPRTNRSASWKYFSIKDSDLRLATCNICGTVCSYRSTLTNLMKHVRQKHPGVIERTNRSASSDRARRISVATNASDAEGSGVEEEDVTTKNLEEFIKRKDEETESMCLLCEERFPDSDPSKVTDHMLNVHNISETKIVEGNIQFQQEVSQKRPRINRSASWKYFTIKDSDLRLATCNICGEVFSYRSSLTNLMKHVRQKHPGVVERTNRSASSDRARRVSVATTASDAEGSGAEEEDVESDVKDLSSRSVMWNFYQIKDPKKKLAECSLCNDVFTYRSGCSTLLTHLKRSHAVMLALSSRAKGHVKTDSDHDKEKPNGTSKRKNSKLWSYFEHTDEFKGKAQCVFCRKRFSVMHGYTSMKRHLMKTHAEEMLLHEDFSDFTDDTPMEVEYLELDNFDETPVEAAAWPSIERRPKMPRISYSPEKPKKDVADSLDNFSKYLASLLQELPDKVSKKLQLDFIKQAIEAQIACDKREFRDSSPSATSLNGAATVRKELGAVRMENFTVSDDCSTVEEGYITVSNDSGSVREGIDTASAKSEAHRQEHDTIGNEAGSAAGDVVIAREDAATVGQGTVTVSNGTVTLSNGIQIGPMIMSVEK